jgi:exonuclease SbcC
MIKSITIHGYESHTKTALKLSEGINVITGPSDAGKSAINRSIRWVVTNRPQGVDCLNWTTKKAEVTIDQVTKSRTRSKHFYKVDGKTYKAFKHEVPGEVQRKLNLSEINFQGQHQSYFLIADSPGQVARELNKISDLTLIDQAIKGGKHKAREAKAKIEIYEEQIGDWENSAELNQWSQDALNDLAVLDKVEAEITALSESIRSLTKVLNDIEEARVLVKSLWPARKDLQTVEKLIDQVSLTETEVEYFPDLEEISDLKAKVKDLSDVGTDLDRVNSLDVLELAQNISDIIDVLKVLKQVGAKVSTLSSIEGMKDKVEQLKDDLDKTQESVTKLTSLIKKVDSTAEELAKKTEEYEKSLRDFHKEMQDLGECPLCGSEVSF